MKHLIWIIGIILTSCEIKTQIPLSVWRTFPEFLQGYYISTSSNTNAFYLPENFKISPHYFTDNQGKQVYRIGNVYKETSTEFIITLDSAYTERFNPVGHYRFSQINNAQIKVSYSRTSWNSLWIEEQFNYITKLYRKNNKK